MKKNLIILMAVLLTTGLFSVDKVDLTTDTKTEVFERVMFLDVKGGLTGDLDGVTDLDGNYYPFKIANDGIQVNTNLKLWFRDSGLYINSSGNGILDLVSDDKIVFTTDIFDVNASKDIDIDTDDENYSIDIGTSTANVDVNVGNAVSEFIVGDNIDIAGDADVDGTTNLDAVDIDDSVDQSGGIVTFNSGGGSYDTTIKGNTDNELVIVDASADKVGISTNAPSHTLDVDGTLEVTGAVTFGSTLATGGKLTAGANEIEGDVFDINGGTIDGVTNIDSTPIGGTTPASGTFTTITANTSITSSGNISLGGNNLILESSGDQTSIEAGTNNRIDFEVDGTNELQLSSGALYSYASGGLDLGIDSGHEFQSIYLTKDVNCDDDLDVGDDADIGGDLDVDGDCTLDYVEVDEGLNVSGSGSITLDATEDIDIRTTDTTDGIDIGIATADVPISIGHTTSETAVNGNIDIGGSHTVNITTVNSATYDLVTTDYILNVTYTKTGAVTSLTLMSAQCLEGRVIVINDGGSSATTNNITIDTEGAEKIDNAATATISTDNGSLSLYSDGSNWFSY